MLTGTITICYFTLALKLKRQHLLRNSSSCIILDFLRIIPLLGTLNAPEILFSFRENRNKAILLDNLDPPVFPLSVTWDGDLEVSFALRSFAQQWWKRMNFFLHLISMTNIMCQHGQNGTQLLTLARNLSSDRELNIGLNHKRNY